jgi:hypothetical protein
VNYLYYRPSGVIQLKGICPDDSPPEPIDGLTLLLLDEPLPDGDWHVAGGAVAPGRLDLRTLEQRKAERWEQIKLARTAAINAPLVTPYGTFDADPASRQNITDAILMVQTLDQLGEPSSIDFTLADNSVVTLTVSEMVDVGLRLGAQVQAAHATSRVLRGQLDAATTAEAVDSVHWPA